MKNPLNKNLLKINIIKQIFVLSKKTVLKGHTTFKRSKIHWLKNG